MSFILYMQLGSMGTDHLNIARTACAQATFARFELITYFKVKILNEIKTIQVHQNALHLHP